MNDRFGASVNCVSAAGEKPSAVKSVRIGLLWHSTSSGNLGVGALTVANMAIIREAAAELGLSPQFTVIQMRDGEISYVERRDAAVFIVNTRSLVSPTGVAAIISRQDCVIDIGAGDSFTDIYGAKRFAYLWLTKMMALIARRPLVLAPQTIGPFTGGLYKRLASFVLARADAVVARDDVSLRVLKDLSPRAVALLSSDVAFALPYEDQARLRDGPRVRVGINVSGLLWNEAEAGSNRFGLSFNYADLMRHFLQSLSTRSDVEVHLIAHVISRDLPEDDDGRVAQRLHEAFPYTFLTPQFRGPSDAKSFISGLDFLVAARMHACIAAFSSGVPVVPVAYSRKFSGLFGMLEYPWIVPVSGMDGPAALAFLNAQLDDRARLAAETRRGLAKATHLLKSYRDLLGTVLGRAATRR